MAANGWSAVLLPRQQAKLARGAKDKEARHVSDTQYRDRRIGQELVHVVGHDARGAICCGKKRGSPIYRLA